MVALAAMQRKGEGTNTDPVAALLLKTAAARGYEPAMADLASMFNDGEGTPPSPAQAELWYPRAAYIGDLKAEWWFADTLAAHRTPDATRTTIITTPRR